MRSIVRKSVALWIAIRLSAMAATPPESPVDSVIQLVKAGMAEDTIIRFLRQEAKPVELAPADLVRLQQAHVSEKIIAVMMDPAAPAPPPPAAAPVPAPSLSVVIAPPAAPEKREVTLPAGTEIAIRMIDAIDSKAGVAGREYSASLDDPITIDGNVVVPARASAWIRIEELKQSGMFKGNASLSLRLTSVTVNGRRMPLQTGDFVSQSTAKGKSTALRAGGGAAGGAGIGALAAGGLGAGVGAAIGGTVGLGSAILDKRSVKVASETRLVFRLTQPAVVETQTGPQGR